MNKQRTAKVTRKTKETDIYVNLNLDGNGRHSIKTGLPFFDHMLALMSRHGGFDLEVEARGDLAVDGHHTVEDVGICLGEALKRALLDKEGITRYGHILLPMDEALVMAAVDLSGRAFLAFDAELPSPRVGDFDTELVQEFFRSLSVNGSFTLHIRLVAGQNTHHIIEAMFKGLGRALKQAASFDPCTEGVPSTKGVL